MVAVAAGCGGEPSEPPASGEPAAVWTRPALDAQDGMEALVAGALGYDGRAGCFYLESGETRYPVVWPAGTTAEFDPIEIHLPGGSTARVGDRVEGAGGYLSPARLAEIDGVDRSIPPACLPETREVAVFNHRADVAVHPASP